MDFFSEPQLTALAAGEGLENLREHFRAAFRSDPGSAYRDWFRVQEELADRGQDETARALADDLWSELSELFFESDEKRARFFHNVAVFFGTPGPAADLARARDAFAIALTHFSEHEENGWRARALHNLATALSNLGQTSAELEESVALFDQALQWRSSDRAIARGVTRHNMGIVFQRLTERDPENASLHREAAAAAFQEAAAIREAHHLEEGEALSRFHLGIALGELAQAGDKAVEIEACCQLDRAAVLFEKQGKHESARAARSRAAALAGESAS